MKEITTAKKKKKQNRMGKWKNKKFYYSNLPPLCQKLDQPSC